MNLLSSPLLTDLYQLTMLKSYFAQGLRERAVFELFVRRLPRARNFMMAAGLAQALDFLEGLRFSAEELEWVERHPLLGPPLAAELEKLRFSGDVHAMPEGTVFFAEEPLLRVTAPLPEAQLVESRLMNLLHYQSLVASKAARAVLAAPGKLLVDFGMRRAHGAEAALYAARASYVAGFAGTATVIAGAQFGIPLYGTMAHSYVLAHDDENAAFRHFVQNYPRGTTLLLDTYDTERGAQRVAQLATELRSAGVSIGAVRLDSGELGVLAERVRATLDNAGLHDVRIFASSSLDECALASLLARGAPIDGFGIGASLVTSRDVPSLDAVYKLQEYAGKPRRKHSTGKATWPGAKQVYRCSDADGRYAQDVLTLDTDVRSEGEALLTLVMRDGRRIAAPEDLQTIRARAARELERLPERLKSLDDAYPPYRVEMSAALRALARAADAQLQDRQALS